MRAVSNGWCKAGKENNVYASRNLTHRLVSTHPFWDELVFTMRPDINQSEPDYVRHFTTAMLYTMDLCLPCVIVDPTRPQRAYVRMPTAKLGRLPVCRPHCGLLCSHCLRTSLPSELGGEHVYLHRSVVGDVDETGCPRQYDSAICYHCRGAAFIATLTRDLTTCSRGGRLHGIGNYWASSASYKDHVYLGVGRSDMMARQAIEDWFLIQHTRYYDLFTKVFPLQQMLRRYKTAVYEHRMVLPPSNEIAHLRSLVWSVFDEEDPVFDLPRLCRRWINEIETGVYNDTDHRLDIERMRQPIGTMSLWPFIRDKLVHRAIDLWVQDRFFFGYWVMPSDDIEQMLANSQIHHTPLIEIAAHAKRPADAKTLSQDQWRSGHGRFRFDTPSLRPGDEHFLPPDRLLQIMNMRFSEIMTTRLENAFAEVIQLWITKPYREWDRIEDRLSHMKPEQLLGHLAQAGAWIDDDDGWVIRNNPQAPASDPGGGSVVSDEVEDDDDDEDEMEEPSYPEYERFMRARVYCDSNLADEDETHNEDDKNEPNEPRIEIVTTNDHLPEYAIRDGWSTASDDERDGYEVGTEHDEEIASEPSAMSIAESITLSPHLGKRKTSDDSEAADEDRPPRTRLGSGHTSHSGDSASTALVTPDESPSLLGGENIRVAEEDDPATDTTPVATLAIGEIAASPAASPTLGKRKSPEDDDLIQPPRRPASPLAAQAPSESSDDDMGESVARGTTNEIDREKASVDAQKTPLSASSFIEEDEERTLSIRAPPKAAPTAPSVIPTSTLNAPATSSHPGGLVFKAAAVTAVPSTTTTTSRSEESDSEESEGSYDMEQINDTPYVPHTGAILGPGVEEIFETTWYRAREPFRRCKCAICERAEKIHTDNLQRIFLSSFEDLVSPGLHLIEE